MTPPDPFELSFPDSWKASPPNLTSYDPADDPVPAGLTVDGQANTCTHMSATGVDRAPFGPDKVWRCDHCGLTWRQGDRS